MNLRKVATLLKKSAPLSASKAQDVALWEQWNRTKSPQDLQALLTHLEPLLNQQVTRWGGTLARPMLESKAKLLTAEAIKSYDPHMGASLGTHVTNQLQKLSRTVYTYSSAARLPEHKAVGMASFGVAQELLRNETGHEPTHEELADHLGWSKDRVSEFQRAYTRRELLTSGEFNPAQFPVADKDDPLVGFVYHDMAPQTKRLFEHITGYGGKPVLSNQELMKKFEITQGQLSYKKRQITDMFHLAMKQDK